MYVKKRSENENQYIKECREVKSHEEQGTEQLQAG